MSKNKNKSDLAMLVHRIAADAYEQSDQVEEFLLLVAADPRMDVDRIQEITDASVDLRAEWIHRGIESPTKLTELTQVEGVENDQA